MLTARPDKPGLVCLTRRLALALVWRLGGRRRAGLAWRPASGLTRATRPDDDDDEADVQSADVRLMTMTTTTTTKQATTKRLNDGRRPAAGLAWRRDGSVAGAWAALAGRPAR